MGSAPKRVYEIIVAGGLGPQWANWFEGLDLICSEAAPGLTSLRGSLDQSALRGVLNRIWDLNLTVVSVTSRYGAGTEAAEGGDDDTCLCAQVG